MSASPTPFWTIPVFGLLFLVIGLALIVWPRPAIALYVRLLRPMRSLFGRLVDWEIGLLESRLAPILVRLFGGFVILSAGAIFFYAANAPR